MRYVEHRRYLAGFLDALAIRDRVTLVGHDWGGVLAADWAGPTPAAVRGLAYLETLVAPVTGDRPNAPTRPCSARCATPHLIGAALGDWLRTLP